MTVNGRKRRSGVLLALAALVALVFAPLAHGVLHGDHLVETLLAAKSGGNTAPDVHKPGKDTGASRCSLYQFCLSSGVPTPDLPDIVPVAVVVRVDIKPLAIAFPPLSSRELPRERGPPRA